MHKTQKLIPTSDKGEDVITALSVSPNKRLHLLPLLFQSLPPFLHLVILSSLSSLSYRINRFLAVAESSEKASVTIFDLASQRKKRTLVAELATKIFTRFLPLFLSSSLLLFLYSSIPLLYSFFHLYFLLSYLFNSIAFSSDSKFLLAQGGVPDWTLVCWHWEKGKQIGAIKTSNPSSSLPLFHLSFNPLDPSLACVSGQGLLKLLRCTESAIKPLPTPPIITLPSAPSTPSPASPTMQFVPPAPALARREPALRCHVWVGEERLVVGTEMGELLLFEMGECRAILPQSPGVNGGSINAIVALKKVLSPSSSLISFSFI